MAARLLANHADCFQAVYQVLHLINPVCQPVLAHAVMQADSQAFHGTPFQAAVSREAFLDDAQGSALGINIEIIVILDAQQPTHRHHGILFRRHGQHIRVLVGLAGDFCNAPVFIFRLTFLNKVGVLCKARGIHDDRDIVFSGNRIHRLQVRQ